MSKQDKDARKPRLPRIPVPPPGRFMEDDKYDRDAEKREAEREIEETLSGPDDGEPEDRERRREEGAENGNGNDA